MAEANKTYKDIQQIRLAVNCIVFAFNGTNLEVLLRNRNFPSDKGKWSLLGGYVKYEENLDDAPTRLLFDLTGLQSVHTKQVEVFGETKRNPTGRVVSITYRGLIVKEETCSQILTGRNHLKWFTIDKLPNLIYDHKDMVISATCQLMEQVRISPIVFSLLPQKFSLPQLQRLYESILQEEIDKRNFRKKLAAMGFLIKLNEKDMSESRKGAFLYQFDREKYNRTKNFNI